MSSAFFSRTAAANELTRWAFAFRAAMAEVRTSIPVKVIAVHSDGGVSPVGRVDLQPLVQQTDSSGKVVDLPVVYGVPYLRWQGGASAVILDPVAGDVGLACFCDRDVSAVVSTAAKAPPGSNRRFSLSDGFYIGGSLNALPTQYVEFLANAQGINIVSPTAIQATAGSGGTQTQLVMNSSELKLSFGSASSITLNSSGIQIHGSVNGDSTATFTGEGTFNGGHTVSAHDHQLTGVQPGSATLTTRPPQG